MKLIKLKNLEDDFYIKLNTNFLKILIRKLEETKQIRAHRFLQTPSCNIKRMEKNGVIRFEHLKKLSQVILIDEEEITKNIRKMKTGDRGIEIPVKLPIEVSLQLAALVGHVIGDGTINSYGAFEYTNSAKEVVEKVKEYIKFVFNYNCIKSRTERKTNTTVHKIIFPSVIGRLLKLAGAPQGKKVTQSFDIPDWIKKGDEKIKSAFLRALFDDDGSVNSGSIVEYINSKRKNLRKEHGVYMNSVAKLLSDLGVTNHYVRYVERGDNFSAYVRITNLRYLELFQNKVGFCHKKRKERLIKYLKKPTRNYTKRGEGEEIILNLLRSKIMATEEIALKINRVFSATRRYLYRLERKGKIERVYPQRHKVKTLWKVLGQEYKNIPKIDSLYSISLILERYGPLNSNKLSEILGKNKATINRNLNELQAQGKVRVIKSDINGYWWDLAST